MATRTEINFRRLLDRCETMAQESIRGNWRLEKYVSHLQSQLNDLRKNPGQLSSEKIEDYSRKVGLLKGLIEAEKEPTSTGKAMATDWIAKISDPGSHARELQVKARVQGQQTMRSELLGEKNAKNSSGSPGLRQRNPLKEEDDINTILQHQRLMQERLAEEMVSLTRNLKQNITESGNIVRKDTQTVTESTKVAQTNLTRLKKESDRLEGHTRTCSWWIYLMVLVVIVVMIWTILFMRLFPKRS